MHSFRKGIFLIFIFSQKMHGQINLVPNPNFETSVNCPTIIGMFSVANWSSFRSSPDYFSSCSLPSSCGTPSNYFGYQQPASGAAYCGLLNIWPGTSYREYLGAKLSQTLSIGTVTSPKNRTV